MTIVRYILCLVFCAVLSSSAVAVAVSGIWNLETTVLPPAEDYPKGVVAEDFEQVLTAYNTYMNAFSAEDYLTVADQLELSSKWIKWKTKLDVVDNFSFIRSHILANYSHSEVKDVSFIAPQVGGYSLFVTRKDKTADGTTLWEGIVIYGFRRVQDKWKISSILNLPSLKSPF